MSSSESTSLVTTAASDTSSSANSRCFSSRGARGGQRITFNSGAEAVHSPSPRTRRSYNLKARGVVIAKPSATTAPNSSGGFGNNNQKVLCVCKLCEGQHRLVSKSTCYRHLRLEAEEADQADDILKRCWSRAYMFNVASRMQALRMYSLMHLAGIRFGSKNPVESMNYRGASDQLAPK